MSWGDCLPKDTQLANHGAGPLTPVDPSAAWPGLFPLYVQVDSLLSVPTVPSTSPGRLPMCSKRVTVTKYQDHARR